MDDLHEAVAKLRALKARKPIPDRRKQVEAALQDKFEGIQSVGLEVLGAWGDAQSVATLRDFLTGCFSRPQGRSIRSAAVKALAPLVKAGDAKWVLDLYFALPDIYAKHEMLWLVTKLPLDAASDRLLRELRSPNWINRHAAVKAIGNMPFSDKRLLLAPLAYDPVAQVRESAALLSA